MTNYVFYGYIEPKKQGLFSSENYLLLSWFTKAWAEQTTTVKSF